MLIALLAAPLPAKERLQQRYDQRNGLPVSEVTSLAQDRDGYLWIGTRGGLVRFDGNEMRVWAPDILPGDIVSVAAGRGQEVITGIERGAALLGRWKQMALYRVTDAGAEPLVGPDGNPLVRATSAKFAQDGSLWVARNADVLRRHPDSTWDVFHLPTGEPVYDVEPGIGSVLLVAESGLWQVDPHGVSQKLVTYPRILVALAVPEGPIYFVEDGMIVPAKLMKLSGDRVEEVLQLAARPLSMAKRGDTVWVAFDRFLVAIRPGESPEIVGPDDGLPSGGPLLVDQEASLWLGTYQGLVQFPEPNTVLWTERDGLPSRHTVFMAAFGTPADGFWVATWQGLGRMHHSARGWRAASEDFLFAGKLCPDTEGRLWLTLEDKFREHSLTRSVFHSVPGLRWPEFCAPAPDGTVWILAPMGLFRSSRASRAPQLITSDFPVSLKDPGAVLHDSRDQIWISEAESIFHTKASGLTRDHTAAWDCQSLSGAGAVFALVELPTGELWAASEQNGVWRYRGGHWLQFRGSTHPPYQKFGSLRTSTAGGAWLLSEGGIARATGQDDRPEEWQILEPLSSWQGVPSVSALDVLERSDGSLWITTVAGLVQLPSEARRAPIAVPRVRLVDVLDNGKRAPDVHNLSYRHLLELRFAALSFRDRSRLRYQMRMHTGEPWQSVNGEPVFRYVDLRTGHYEVEVRASLDGARWSAQPAWFAFEVLPPWYRETWALAMFGVIVAGLLYLAYRARVAVLLRFERQRAQIAMDLHDEMGSGLGSIRILAGLATDQSLGDSERAATANQIAETSGELGTALGEIVWSLRPGSDRLDALVAHLVERGARLFPGEGTVFHAEIPDVLPIVHLSLGVRRAVALIALEAMHNAARHAQAKRVTVGLAPEGRRWKLWVADDGRGLDLDATKSGSGMGVANMRTRAQEIGAQLSIAQNGTKGTVVTITFTP